MKGELPAIELLGEHIASVNTLPDEQTRQRWCDWLRRHSVDPDDVKVPGMITRMVELRRVAYLSWRNAPGAAVMLDSNGVLREWIHTVQLEATPAPFPPTDEQ